MPTLASGDMLERRNLLTVGFTSIVRQTSTSLLDGPVSDPVSLLPGPGTVSFVGSTQIFTGYTYDGILIGGGGLAISFRAESTAAIGARPVIVQVDWGDSDPANQSPFNPTFQSVTIQPPSATALSWSGSVVLPHIYANSGTFAAIVQIIEVPLPGEDVQNQAIANITIQAGHVVEGSQGLFLRGSTGADHVQIGPTVGGVTFVQAQFGSTSITQSTTASNIYVEALAGNDVILADAASTTALFADGGNDDDRIEAGAGEASLLGGPGDDVLVADLGPADMFGAAGSDLLVGGPGADMLDGGSDDDTIIGHGGDDTLFGGQGDDELDGGAGADQLIGGLGADRLLGGFGDDVLIGGWINVVQPNFPSNLIRMAWADYDIHGLGRIMRSPVVQPATDLSGVPFAITASGRNRVHAIRFGSLVSNDGTVDVLEGGAGSNAVVANQAGRATSDRVVPVARSEGRIAVVRLRDHTLPTVKEVVPFTGYVTSNGLDMINDPTRGTYVLYRTVPDGNNLFRTLPFEGVHYTDFQAFYGRPAPARYRLDNVKEFAIFRPLMTYWTDFNRPFLVYGIAFGGIYVTSSDPNDPKNLYNERDASESAFKMELNYLAKATTTELYPSPFRPYVYDPLRRLFYQPNPV